MDTSYPIGALLPMWILGAPLVLALFSLFSMARSGTAHGAGRELRHAPLEAALQRPLGGAGSVERL